MQAIDLWIFYCLRVHISIFSIANNCTDLTFCYLVWTQLLFALLILLCMNANTIWLSLGLLKLEYHNIKPLVIKPFRICVCRIKKYFRGLYLSSFFSLWNFRSVGRIRYCVSSFDVCITSEWSFRCNCKQFKRILAWLLSILAFWCITHDCSTVVLGK